MPFPRQVSLSDVSSSGILTEGKQQPRTPSLSY